MLKFVLSAVAATVLVAGLGVGTADAKSKHHKRKPAVVAAATCDASPLMKDETRLHYCFGMKKK